VASFPDHGKLLVRHGQALAATDRSAVSREHLLKRTHSI
jgi:hypothetical protein